MYIFQHCGFLFALHGIKRAQKKKFEPNCKSLAFPTIVKNPILYIAIANSKHIKRKMHRIEYIYHKTKTKQKSAKILCALPQELGLSRTKETTIFACKNNNKPEQLAYL